ncbi:hypothetical protein SAMN05661091_4707 [Paenibacillus uliginis N3/975]|uniref:FlgN protein n=1 Tax=Paenibacillus uliginis N3/975 TaxID=1313296 RepID=A0A1X7HMT1_9BACL|nr:hypothetical protein [Paenibacillus uliginis]SMF89597.1 hypothetical protein SAMN05661091_4707 [Paenibacillus uliginis N3/975]
MTSVQSIASKLSQVSMVLTEMQQSGNCDQLAVVLNDLGQMDAELKTVQSQITPETSETLRQDLVNCRMALYGMQNIVSEIRSDTAQRYRQVLGDQKTSFEQMNDPDQQSAYPEAYQHRQVFKQMDAVSGHLHQLNGAIMDASYQAGREQNGGGTVYGDIEQNDLTSGTNTTGWS